MKTLLTLLFLSFAGLSYAQTDTAATHRIAAEKLVESLDLQKNFKSKLDAMIVVQARNLPEEQRQKYAAAMLEFTQKYITWPAMRESYVAIYLSEFSESELNELTLFYHSPIGKKLIDKTAVISAKETQIGQKLIADHQLELQDIVLKYFQ